MTKKGEGWEMEFFMKEEGFYTELPYGKLPISGKEGYGFRPYQLFVSSVAGCSGGVLRKVLKKMRLDVKQIQIKADVERNPEEANRIERIHLHFIIEGKDLDHKKVEKALALARKNCAMIQSVEGKIRVEESFEMK